MLLLACQETDHSAVVSAAQRTPVENRSHPQSFIDFNEGTIHGDGLGIGAPRAMAMDHSVTQL